MRLVLRCDGSATLGHGHLARGVALAQAARRRGHAPIFAVRPDPVGSALPRRFGFEVLDATRLSDWLAPGAADWVVLDGYAFEAGLVREVQSAGARACHLDDLGAPLPADLVVNPNLFAPPSPGPAALHGPRYALLREEFAQARAARRSRGVADPSRRRRVLVSFGGSDVAGLAARSIEALGSSPLADELELVAVLGASHPHPRAVQAAAERSRAPVELITSTEHMAEVMSQADAAVASAGLTAVELMCVGVPSALLAVADNQRPVGPAAQALGASIDLGHARDFDTKRLYLATARLLDAEIGPRMSAEGCATVDGLGAERVIAAMERP